MTLVVPQLKGEHCPTIVFSIVMTLLPGNIWWCLDTFLIVMSRRVWLVSSEQRPRMLSSPYNVRDSPPTQILSNSNYPLSVSLSVMIRKLKITRQLSRSNRKLTKHKQKVWRKHKSWSRKGKEPKTNYHLSLIGENRTYMCMKLWWYFFKKETLKEKKALRK